MAVLTYHNLHKEFKLNGLVFTKESLIQAAQDYSQSDLDAEQDFGRFVLNWFDDKPYVEVKTSGTTGKPKIIKVQKQAMVNSAMATGIFFDLKAGNKALCCLPVQYIAGKMMLVRAFVLGFDLDFVAPSSHPLDQNSSHYDFAAMVPLQVENSLPQLHHIKKLIIGGAQVHPNLEEKLIHNPCQSYETYSMTETVTHIAAKRVGEKAFTILPNITISQDERQCLVISAPTLTEGDLITNDIVELISENQFCWLGRYDNVINSGGIKLIPEQIEEKLSHTITNRFFVAGIADERLGQKLILVIEGNPYDLKEQVFSALSQYEKPKAVHFVPKFKETGTGKVKRNEIVKSL
ncbi:AMP-binding protein [Flavobacterium humi]|uniref:O-succinylbenzoic acid--CoA ligase n=1 Tax=Flavobacterium humi TaxID=2562683 RepID=A0A4Z0LD31_9FLAO|nr:AMP-binding protein [Flavobacterium humi]TGD59775.1 O-succinylbenzoic acid--CoA ligase [Flavobacterium humi]